MKQLPNSTFLFQLTLCSCAYMHIMAAWLFYVNTVNTEGRKFNYKTSFFFSTLQKQISFPSSKQRCLYTSTNTDVQLSRFLRGGSSNGCRALALNIDLLYIKMQLVWWTQRLLCPAEKAACFCFSSSPSLPLQQLSMSHLRPPSHTNTHNQINASFSAI